MSEIPEWAMQKAKVAWRNACNYPQDLPIADGRPTVEIARALISTDSEATKRERDRCASINPQIASDETDEFKRGFEVACIVYASSIRKGEKK